MSDKIIQLKDDNGNNLFPIAAKADEREVYTGTTAPAASLGKNGDIYILIDGSSIGSIAYLVNV